MFETRAERPATLPYCLAVTTLLLLLSLLLRKLNNDAYCRTLHVTKKFPSNATLLATPLGLKINLFSVLLLRAADIAQYFERNMFIV